MDCRPVAARPTEGKLCASDRDPGSTGPNPLSGRVAAKPEPSGESYPEALGAGQPEAEFGSLQHARSIWPPHAGGDYCRWGGSQETGAVGAWSIEGENSPAGAGATRARAGTSPLS